MGRFGWAKKKALKEGRTVTDSNDDTQDSIDSPRQSVSDLSVPHVSVPYVESLESLMNMHQSNGLSESTPVEPRNGHTPVVSEPPENPPQPSSNHTNGDATSEWSAVGHAAATGKSGRVIHNLQEEIARLKRECSVYRARAEETQRMNEVFKTQVQNMTDQLRNLELANEMNRNSIQRKDNKIEGLKAELQGEKNRRQQAEGETSRTHQEMTDRRDEFDHKTAELTDIANHARTQYDVLAQSSQRDRADLQRRFQVIRSDIASLKDISGKKDVRLERLDTIMAQKNREIDNSRESFDKLFGDYTAYKQAHDDEVRGMVERGRHHDERLDAALASLKETEGRMRWVMQQDAIQRHKTERGAA